MTRHICFYTYFPRSSRCPNDLIKFPRLNIIIKNSIIELSVHTQVLGISHANKEIWSLISCFSFIIPVMKKGRSVGRRRYHAGPQSADPAWLSPVDNVVNSADVDLPRDPTHPSSAFQLFFKIEIVSSTFITESSFRDRQILLWNTSAIQSKL